MLEDLAEVLARLQRNSNGDSFACQLSPDERSRLLKWYSGNPFDTQDGTLKQALKVFQWCEENSDVFEFPPEMRLARMEVGARAVGIPVNRLKSLMASSSTLHRPSSTMRLIAFEGIDDAENVRQIELLQAYLVQKEVSVISMAYPNCRGFFGREIASLLSSDDAVLKYNLDSKSLALWFALDRKMSVAEVNCQRDNSFVLFNRYTLSNVVYQSARSNADLADWIFQLEHTHLGIPAPDLYIVLDILPSLVQAKVNPSVHPGAFLGTNEESNGFLTVARQRYRQLATLFPQLQFIECMAEDEKTKTSDQIHAEVLSSLRHRKLLG
jgi:dTMP kinase